MQDHAMTATLKGKVLVSDRRDAASIVFGHWCPYCRVAVTLAEIADDAAAIGVRIIAIVADRE